MTNMIQVNDCLADTISGGVRLKKVSPQWSKFKFVEVMEFKTDTNMGTYPKHEYKFIEVMDFSADTNTGA